MTTLDRKSLLFVLCLSTLAGYVDSIGFLNLNGYFVSFMSGNSTRLGVNLGSMYWSEAGMALLMVATFVLGVVIGSLVSEKGGERRRSAVLILVAILLSTAAIVELLHWRIAGMLAMLLAMGAENTVLRGDGVNVGLTYMTGNLVKLGSSIADHLRHRQEGDWPKFLCLWLSLVVGAALGAFTFRYLGVEGLWLAVIFVACLTAFQWQNHSSMSSKGKAG